MLILSRKNGQKLVINENIEIVILESSNNLVKLGIKAPKDVSIYREELFQEIKSSNKEAEYASIDELLTISDMLNQKNCNSNESSKSK